MSTRITAPGTVAPRRVATSSPAFAWVAPILAVALGGYLFFGRAFAYLHVPSTPIFVGEIVLAAALLQTLRVTPAVPAVLRDSLPLRVLVVLLGLAAARLPGDVLRYGLDALRDSALVLYALFALLVTLGARVYAPFVPRLAAWYQRALPWFVVWAPLAVVLNRRFGAVAPRVPDSSTSVLSLKPGDLAVFAALAIAWLWICEQPVTPLEHRRRQLGTAAGLLAIVVAGSQNRGGLVSAALMLLVALGLFVRVRWQAVATSAGIVAIVLAVGVVTDVHIELGDRDISVTQLLANVAVTAGRTPADAPAGNLDDTVEWRLTFWRGVVDDALEGELGIAGLGFGPNLADRYGYQTAAPGEEQRLRSVHNSHLSVLARLGPLGFGLWLVFWTVWVVTTARFARREAGGPAPSTGGALAAWTVVGVLGILFNAVFDPTLESPQIAVWAWTLVGLGVAARWFDTLPGPRGAAAVVPGPAHGAAPRAARPAAPPARSV